MLKPITPSELVLKPNGAIYHLNLLPEDLADTVILVGDPDRVKKVSQHFDSIETVKSNREFVIHTGHLGKKRLTVLSTGMGSENIDIVINELDALVNIDLTTRSRKSTKKQLNIIRLGTCGALHSDTQLDEIVISSIGIGLSNLMAFYQYSFSDFEKSAMEQFKQHYPQPLEKITFFAAAGNAELVQHFSSIGTIGHTLTCAGFYAPQGRELNGALAYPDFFDQFANLKINHIPVKNLEMETAAIYGLGKVFGHRCCSISNVVAQRASQKFTKDIDKGVNNMAIKALEKITEL